VLEAHDVAEFVHHHTEQVHLAGSRSTVGGNQVPILVADELVIVVRGEVDKPAVSAAVDVEVQSSALDLGEKRAGQIDDLDLDRRRGCELIARGKAAFDPIVKSYGKQRLDLRDRKGRDGKALSGAKAVISGPAAANARSLVRIRKSSKLLVVPRVSSPTEPSTTAELNP